MKKELLEQLEREFDKTKQELGFKTTLDELDSIFFVRDFIQDKGFVSTSLSRMMCARIVELFMNWYGYLHSIIIPNPQSILNITESQLFDEQKKQEIQQMMSRILALTSQNGINGLKRDKKAESEFIDQSVSTINSLKPKLLEVLGKVNENWKEKAEKGELPLKRPSQFG